jgi:hypothetical protein
MIMQLFWGGFVCVFCWSFWQKRVTERGFSVVNSWWDAGGSWYVDSHFSRAKMMPRILDLFVRDSRFGND